MTDEDDGFYAQHDRDTLVQFTIYELAEDPKQYVVRRIEIRKDEREPVITKFFRVGRTLGAARAHLPHGLFPLARDPSDHPSVVETWI